MKWSVLIAQHSVMVVMRKYYLCYSVSPFLCRFISLPNTFLCFLSFQIVQYNTNFSTVVVRLYAFIKCSLLQSESAMCLDPDLSEPRYDLIVNCLLQPYCVHILERALLRPETPAQSEDKSLSSSDTVSTPNLLAPKTPTNGLQHVLTELIEKMILDSDVTSQHWNNLITNIQLLILKNQAIKVPIFMNAVITALKRNHPKWKLGDHARKLYFLLVSFLSIITLNQTIQVTDETLNQLVEIDQALASNHQMSCFDLETANVEEMSRLILWFTIKTQTQKLKYSDVDFPRELQISQAEVQNTLQKIDKDTKISLYVKLLNFSSSMEASTNQLQKKLVSEILNSPTQTPVKLIGNLLAAGELSPLDFKSILNLTMSLKIVLFQQITTHWKQLMPQLEKAGVAGNINVLFPSPALVETYGRLYMDTFFETFYQATISIDSVIQGAIQQACYRTFLVCAEIFVLFLPRLNMAYFYTFCSHCINLSNYKHRLKYMESSQFYFSLENICIQMMSSFGVKNFIALAEKYNSTNMIIHMISPDNEDYNKLFMLNIARCMHISGVDCFDKMFKTFFEIIQGKTPHMLSHHMLHNMPTQLITLYQSQPFFQVEVNQKLKQEVENEYHNFLKLLTRPSNEVVNYILQLKGQYFLCFFWKLLLSEDETFKPPPLVCATILEQIGPRNLTKHIQTFCDFVNYEMLTNGAKGMGSKFVDVINKMIWDYNVMTTDRFVFAMLLRPFGQKEDQVSLFSIHLLLQNSHELKERIIYYCDLVDKNDLRDPETKGGVFANWQLPYNQKYEENFHFEGIYKEHNAQPQNRFFFPTYFSNLCVRFVPIFDLVLTRFLEIPLLFKHLSTLLTSYGRIFRLHKQPITFLYKTVAYYKKVIETEGARLLVMTVVDAFKNSKPPEWLVSHEFLENAGTCDSFKNWNPATSYLNSLIEKLTRGVFMAAKCEPFCRFNWETEEFTSVASHLLYSVCLEILCLPNMTPQTVVDHLFHLAIAIESDMFNKFQRLNSVSLILNHLPPIYYSCIETSILTTMSSDEIRLMSPLAALEVSNVKNAKQSSEVSATVLKAQYLYYHANISHLNLARQFLTEKLKPLVKTEAQLIVFCHLLSPFFLIYSDNKHVLKTLYADVIELLPVVAENLPKSTPSLLCEDLFVDLLYFGKYTSIGDDLKPLVDKATLTAGPLMTNKMKFF